MTTTVKSPAGAGGVRVLIDGATAALDDARIAWCRLRDREGTAEDDLLVAVRDGSRLAAVLGAVGWVEVRRLGRASHRQFHATDQDGTWAKLDIVTRIDLGPYGEVRTALARPFLERRTGASTLHPDDAFWALVLHELWDRPAPGIRRLAPLQALAAGATVDGPGARVAARLLADESGPASIIAATSAGDVDRLVEIGQLMRRRVGRRALVHRSLRRVARYVDRRDPPLVRRGIEVALLGPDGAGKSSIATRLAADGPLPRRTVYLGLYGGGPRHGPLAAVPLTGTVTRLLRMWRGWLTARWHVLRGRLVIDDRHPSEAGLPSERRIRRPNGRWLLARAIPMPDLIFVLDVTPEVLHARKAEQPVATLAALRRRYLTFAEGRRDVIVVDAHGPLDAVSNDISARVWRRLAERGSG